MEAKAEISYMAELILARKYFSEMTLSWQGSIRPAFGGAD